MKKNTPLCIQYGWNEELEENFKTTIRNTHQVDGFWIVKKGGNKYYWYFRLLGDKRKDIYLCELNKTFSQSFNVLINKLSGSHNKSSNKKPLVSFIDQYLLDLENRGRNQIDNITFETVKNRSTGIKDFRTYCEKHYLTLGSIDSDPTHSRLVIKNWVDTLIKRQLKKGTIKSYMKSVRLMIQDFSRGKEFTRGYGLIKNNFFTNEYQKNLLDDTTITVKEDKIREYRDEYYWEVRRLCLGKIREIWMDYCENKQVTPIRDRNNKINQPSNSLGNDVVYFISFLQLISGSRVKEILHSFVDREMMEEHRNLHNTPSSQSYSFWEYDRKNHSYFLTIKMKRKFRKVPFFEVIHSYHKPPEHIPCKYVSLKRKQNGYNGYYQTNLIDVLFELSSNDWFMFPSPNLYSNKQSPRSLNYYLNTFNKIMKGEHKLSRYGINTTHNLRSYFISFMIRGDKMTPLQLSELVGHTLQVMEERYKRENLQHKFDVIKRLDHKTLMKNIWKEKEE